jgi:hypothetical protein
MVQKNCLTEGTKAEKERLCERKKNRQDLKIKKDGFDEKITWILDP